MAEVASAYVSLIPSAKGFGKGIARQIGGDLDGAGREGGRRYGSGLHAGIGPSLKGIATAIGAAFVFKKGADLLTFGLSVAANNEQAQISFETMLGSATKAQAFLGKLKQFAASTPFEFPELQKAASSLISAGVNANKVIPIMTTLGDVTSGMGTGAEGVQRATIALQQMNAAGRITGEDLNQLRDAGIPVYDLLAKATGKSKAEVVKLAQAGKLGSKELGQMMKALETGAGLEKFSGLMDKQSASLSGMWSTLKDTIGQGLATAIAPSLPVLKILLDYGSQLAGKVFASLGRILPVVAQGISDLIAGFTLNAGDFASLGDGVGKWVAYGQKARVVALHLWAGLKNLGGTLSRVAGFLRENNQVVVPLVAAFLSGVVAFKVLTAVVRAYIAVQAALNFVLTANPIGIVIVLLAALAGGLIVAYKRSETFRNIVQTAFKGVSAAAKFMWEGVLRPVFKFIVGAFLNLAGAIVNGAAKAFGWVPGLGPKLKAAAAKFNEFRDNVNAALDGTHSKKSITIITPGMRTAINELADLKYRIDHIPRSVTIGVNNKLAASGLAGARAGGGPVAAGKAYLVGEHRPEVFVPDRAGKILPDASAVGRGGGLVVNGNVYGADAKEIVDEQERRERRRAALLPVYA